MRVLKRVWLVGALHKEDGRITFFDVYRNRKDALERLSTSPFRHSDSYTPIILPYRFDHIEHGRRRALKSLKRFFPNERILPHGRQAQGIRCNESKRSE